MWRPTSPYVEPCRLRSDLPGSLDHHRMPLSGEEPRGSPGAAGLEDEVADPGDVGVVGPAGALDEVAGVDGRVVWFVQGHQGAGGEFILAQEAGQDAEAGSCGDRGEYAAQVGHGDGGGAGQPRA